MAPEILLVEDNPGDILLVTEALRASGWAHHLSVLRNGAEAVAYLSRQGDRAGAALPDLVLLDLNLPLMNGYEVLEELGRDAQLADLPVFLLSGSRRDLEGLRAKPFPEGRYFIKPFSFQGYLTLMEELRAMTSPPARHG
jgi:two-component system, chemotaxis family, response regulator Rcp1